MVLVHRTVPIVQWIACPPPMTPAISAWTIVSETRSGNPPQEYEIDTVINDNLKRAGESKITYKNKYRGCQFWCMDADGQLERVLLGGDSWMQILYKMLYMY